MAAAAFRLSIYLTFIGSILSTAAYYIIVPKASIAFPGFSALSDLTFIYIGIFIASLYSIVGAAHSRANQYNIVALSKFNISLFPTVAQIILGMLSASHWGLQVGRLIGVAATCVVMLHRLPARMSARALLRPRVRELRLVAWRYRDSIMHIPRELLMRAGTGLPPAMLLASYNASAAGFFFFAERLVERPGLLLSDALTRIPMKIFAELVQERKPVVRLAVMYSALCTAIVAIGIFFVVLGGRPLFGFLFGPSWIEAADYAVALAIGAGVRIGTLPVASLVPVLRIQKSVLVLDAFFFPRVLAIPAAAAVGYSAIVAISIFAALTVVYNVATFTIAIVAGLRYEKTTNPLERRAH